MPNNNALINRRAFLGATAVVGAAALLARHASAEPSATAAKPNSVIDGVKIGCITYSYRGAHIDSAEQTLAALVKSGLSETELMDGPIKAYTGIGGATPTDAQREAQLAKCADLRKMYNDAGVNIHIHKTPFGKTDEDIEFNFLIAKALGCVAITTERNEELAKRLAPFAEKHKIYVAFHNHTNNVPVTDSADPLLDIGKYIVFNLDIGHYYAGTKGQNPVPVIEKYHDRIISLHLKDRTADGRNLSWGKGTTPIKEALQLLKKRNGRSTATLKWNIRFRRNRTRWQKWRHACSIAAMRWLDLLPSGLGLRVEDSRINGCPADTIASSFATASRQEASLSTWVRNVQTVTSGVKRHWRYFTPAPSTASCTRSAGNTPPPSSLHLTRVEQTLFRSRPWLPWQCIRPPCFGFDVVCNTFIIASEAFFV